MNRPLVQRERFEDRHNGPRGDDIDAMLADVGAESLDQLIDQTVPAAIRVHEPLELTEPLDEAAMIDAFRELMDANQVVRSLIGMGHYDTITPPVIQRNILENPGWYTQYTPYQSEIAQGRMEALLNFQTLTSDLTGLPCANSSLLDEGTAAAEAMAMALSRKKGDDPGVFVVDPGCHPQTIEVVQTRAEVLGLEVVVDSVATHDYAGKPAFGVLVQYPATDGSIGEWEPTFKAAKDAGATCVVATDLLALTLLRAPAEFGAEIVVGNSQRFGVPFGYGGPHAAFMTAVEDFKRRMPGRIVGVSVDADGNPGLRLALQTREQHIRRDRATSNICTAQVLLAVMASMYAVYHGPDGLRRIASRVRLLAETLRDALAAAGLTVGQGPIFDTLWVETGDRDALLAKAREAGFNLRPLAADRVGISLDEKSTLDEVAAVASVFGATVDTATIATVTELADYPAPHARQSEFLTHPVFHSHRSETELLRYIFKLQGRDLSLTHSMIALGSCTMKLNATTEMLPVTWSTVGGLHPFAPVDQAQGYAKLFAELEADLATICGMAGVSLQPNAGSQGEYAGLLVINAYLKAQGQGHRDICLIPSSAHGTNPASAVMAGMKVVVVKCDDQGNIDVDDLARQADKHADNLAALMVTYPSTHGVFEEAIQQISQIVHDRGGQVYMDGANLNAQVGLTSPGKIGADVCHLNLHKTFCIPHGGGGPGMGPIAVAAHLVPHLPRRPVLDAWDGTVDPQRVGAVSAAPWGSASILPISYTYIKMMGGEGLTQATKVAILGANYVAKKLEDSYPILYKGSLGRVAHECILDLRDIKKTSGVTVEDIAKRLMDYGFHAPTVSFPVAGTMMVEPTESESKAELDRFVEAMIRIREEIAEIERGEADKADNLLKNAPHTAQSVARDEWPYPYSRQRAAFPTEWTREVKFWPPVARIDNVHGDRNLVCTCPPVEAYAS